MLNFMGVVLPNKVMVILYDIYKNIYRLYIYILYIYIYISWKYYFSPTCHPCYCAMDTPVGISYKRAIFNSYVKLPEGTFQQNG